MEQFRVSGILVEVSLDGKVYHDSKFLGSVSREERLGQWFWRAHSPEDGIPYHRFMTARHEAIRLLLIYADLMDGLGF